MDSTPIENDGDKESPQTSALLRTLDITCVSLPMAFSMPYSTSVRSVGKLMLVALSLSSSSFVKARNSIVIKALNI